MPLKLFPRLIPLFISVLDLSLGLYFFQNAGMSYNSYKWLIQGAPTAVLKDIEELLLENSQVVRIFNIHN